MLKWAVFWIHFLKLGAYHIYVHIICFFHLKVHGYFYIFFLKIFKKLIFLETGREKDKHWFVIPFIYSFIHYFFFKLNLLVYFSRFIYLFSERREEEREGEKHWCARDTSIGCLLHASAGDLACNPGMHPDWESKWRPFGSQASTQSTELHQPGLFITSYVCLGWGLNLSLGVSRWCSN